MKLCECKIGVLVCVKPDALESDQLLIGHVVGLADPEFRASTAILDKLKTKPGMPPKTQKVWPVVKFCGQETGTIIDYNNLDLFTAY